MRVCESLMKREPPMPHDFAHDGMESTDWRMLAACLDEDPELFFPTGTTLSAKMQAAVAREVCTQCVVVPSNGADDAIARLAGVCARRRDDRGGGLPRRAPRRRLRAR